MRRSTRVVLATTLPAAAAVLIATGPAVADPTASPTTPTPAAPSPVGPPPGPQAIDQDGTYAVGTDIPAGVYASAGPVDGGTCYWKRVGADNATLGNALTKQPQVVVIEATDVAFKTNGCQPWQLTDGPPPAETPPWLAQLQLRHNLDVLNGLAGQSGNGQLPPY